MNTANKAVTIVVGDLPSSRCQSPPQHRAQSHPRQAVEMVHYLRYRLPDWFRLQALSMLPIFAVAVAFFDVSDLMGVASKHGSVEDLAFPAFFTFAFLWTGYGLTFRFAYMVEARGNRADVENGAALPPGADVRTPVDLLSRL